MAVFLLSAEFARFQLFLLLLGLQNPRFLQSSMISPAWWLA